MERAEKNGRIRAMACPDQAIQRGGYLLWEQYISSLRVQLIGCGLHSQGNYRFAMETHPGGKILFSPAEYDMDTQEYSSRFSTPSVSCLFFMEKNTPLLYAPLNTKYDISAGLSRLRDALNPKHPEVKTAQEEADIEKEVDLASQVELTQEIEQQQDIEQSQENEQAQNSEQVMSEPQEGICTAEEQPNETARERSAPSVPSCFRNWRRYSPPEMLAKYASLSSFITYPNGSRFAAIPLKDDELILGELPVEDHIISICAYPAITNPVLKPVETSLTLPLRNGKTCWTSEALDK